jgi:predicted enzyme related to lactoylglutathione lyase
MSLIYPTNIERSVNFYRTLGFTLSTERKLWAELRLGDAALGLQGSDPWVRGEQIRLVLISKVDLEELIAELQKNGIRVDHEIADEAYGRSVLIHDPDGNPILINEYDPDLYP